MVREQGPFECLVPHEAKAKATLNLAEWKADQVRVFDDVKLLEHETYHRFNNHRFNRKLTRQLDPLLAPLKLQRS